MAIAAIGRVPIALGRLRGQIRGGRIALWLGATIILLVGALQLGPFMPAGADLADPAQRLYAANLWEQVRVSLVFIACFLPWLTYALLWRSAAGGGWLLVVVAFAGTALATWLTVMTVETYAALPSSVSGVVSRVEGRALQLAETRKQYYMVLSDGEMASASSWLKRGAAVRMWVSPRGQVGAVELEAGGTSGG